jgi:hypothetical protein
MTFLEMDTESKFTILPGCYDNGRHLRKYLGIYVIAQEFTKMTSHLGKCPIYVITVNIYTADTTTIKAVSAKKHLLLLYL